MQTKKSAQAEKAKLERGMQPHLKNPNVLVMFSRYMSFYPFICDAYVRDCSATNRSIARLLRISRQKVAQQKNIGEYKSPGRQGRKKNKGKGKKKSFPKQWVMKFAEKVTVAVQGYARLDEEEGLI